MPVFSMKKIRETAVMLVNQMAEQNMKFTEAEKTLDTAKQILHSNMIISKVDINNNEELCNEFVND